VASIAAGRGVGQSGSPTSVVATQTALRGHIRCAVVGTAPVTAMAKFQQAAQPPGKKWVSSSRRAGPGASALAAQPRRWSGPSGRSCRRRRKTSSRFSRSRVRAIGREPKRLGPEEEARQETRTTPRIINLPRRRRGDRTCALCLCTLLPLSARVAPEERPWVARKSGKVSARADPCNNRQLGKLILQGLGSSFLPYFLCWPQPFSLAPNGSNART
jgi:hypothetical protein